MDANISFKEMAGDLREKYQKVKNLLGNKDNSNNNPAESLLRKNGALNILKDMLTQVSDAKDKVSESEKDTLQTMSAILKFDIALIHVDLEEMSSGSEYLLECMELLKGKELRPETIVPVISALNQLGILYAQWEQQEKAKTFLVDAERLYKEFTNTSQVPVSMGSLFDVQVEDEGDPGDLLDKLHILTTYYLAQVYGNLKDHFKSSSYCHITLRRQLPMDEYERVEWAVNAATLSQFFMEKGGFSQARHHLTAASYVLMNFEESLKSLSPEVADNEKTQALLNEVRHRGSDIARCWAKYGLLLLSNSRDRLMEEEVDEADSETTRKNKEELKELHEKWGGLRFDFIENDVIFKQLEAQITCEYLLDFGDAKPVFLMVLKWLQEAKEFYTLENHASDHVEIVQDTSQAYKNLAFFEDNEDNQAKMHKRRVDVLEAVVKELSATYYKEQCQEIWYELGETYSDILKLKLDKMKANDDKLNPHMLTKINNLCFSAIKNFQSFLDSLKSKNPDAPLLFPDEITRPALCAYFHIGSLYNKFITVDKRVQLDNVRKSIDVYKTLIKYCEEHEKARESMHAEYAICKEMVQLLPVKISKLHEEIGCLSITN